MTEHFHFTNQTRSRAGVTDPTITTNPPSAPSRQDTKTSYLSVLPAIVVPVGTNDLRQVGPATRHQGGPTKGLSEDRDDQCVEANILRASAFT
jgi:hypothetical protein